MMNVLRRIGLWFGSLLVSATLFSLFFNLLFSGPGFSRVQSVFIIFRITMMIAFPVWCFSLPLAIALKDAEGRRAWIIFLIGMLIGPAAFCLWGVVLLLRGADPHLIWYGDPVATGLDGVRAGMVFALIVGFLTASFYVSALSRLRKRETSLNGGSAARP